MPIKILRAILIGILLVVIGIPLTTYIMLSTSWAQARLTATAQEALLRLLGTEAKVEEVQYAPFNRLNIRNISVCDDFGEECLSIAEIQVRVELGELLMRRKVIIDYVVIDGIDVRISKATPQSPLNISGIIARFNKNDQEKKPANFALRLNDLEIINSQVSYNVASADTLESRFDPNHIHLSDISVGIHAPRISNEGISIQLSQLKAKEQSGLEVTNMRMNLSISPTLLTINNLAVEMPESQIAFGPVSAPLTGVGSIARIGTTIPTKVELLSGSHVALADLAAFAPILAKSDIDANISATAQGVLSDIELENLNINCDAATLGAKGRLTGLPNPDSLRFSDARLNLAAVGSRLTHALASLGINLSHSTRRMVESAGFASMFATYNGGISGGNVSGKLATDCGTLLLDGNFSRANSRIRYDADTKLVSLNLGKMLSVADLGTVSGTIQSNGIIHGRKIDGTVSGNIQSAVYKDYVYSGISFDASASDTELRLEMDANDPNLDLSLIASALKNPEQADVYALGLDLRRANLHAIHLTDKLEGYSLSTEIAAKAKAISPSQFTGDVAVRNLEYIDSMHSGLMMKRLAIDADCMEEFREINIESDFINGGLQGYFNLTTLPGAVRSILSKALPQLLTHQEEKEAEDYDEEPIYENDFSFDFTIDNAEDPCKFFKLPVSILDPVSITGHFSDKDEWMLASIDADWLIQGDKLIEDTHVTAVISGKEGKMWAYATTFYPTKKGPMNLLAQVKGSNGILDTDIDWELVRDIPISGKIDFATLLARDASDKIMVTVNLDPGRINFGNALWEIMPASILYCNKSLTVNNFALVAPTQSIHIYGHVTDQPEDVLTVNLDNIELEEIFETLEIDKAMLCGSATGQIAVSQLFTKLPVIASTTFKVKGMGYNRCVLGDADIQLGLDGETNAFWFDADLAQPGGYRSSIVGSIIPATEELDLHFVADHVRVGFMQPFMEAFCSHIDGYASGQAHLFGTFKYIDLEAENLVADSLRMKINFTNTWYHTGIAPISIKPGSISFKNVTIYDDYNNTAKLTGYVNHEFFKKPTFKFDVTQARNFLCYDMPKSPNERWWGTIFGNGSANIDGKPGVVKIGVKMTTCENSKFTFALLDTEVAEEYSFITFRDATPKVDAKEFYEMIVESASVNRADRLNRKEEDDAPTAYDMDIQVNATPSALVTLVMDPISGDEIRAYGSGFIHMAYGSRSGALNLYGTYQLERGDYNFTLQDIIIREFNIRRGSSIKFDGDPYKATLNINAVYQTNANLSDLDESFLSDKDLNRTNVPVYAVMNITGNMMQPNIKFDLEFPTLTEDITNKVRSIVSTEDLMNRQIIYLLALNRFYTPDYMSTTKGNELFSVASSTIASQLSSMLGKLSDNWSIAPNLRSDRGDFSDVEVDVNLSSRLLNNRLLFNGNFGYRDKSLNTNQFVGDFDIEYLINRNGTLRLKAYNRYNDQNYYLRTAQTTQGIGVIIRHDFNTLRNLFKHRKQQPDSVTSKTDSIK